MQRILYIDADTILYSSAAKEEINKCLVTNTINNKTKLFESKTAFNEWYKEHPTHPKDVYTFQQEKELVGEISYACKSVRSKIEGIAEKAGCDDFRVCIQGVGNYRNDYVSKYVDYKGQRTGKPLLYSDVFNYITKKYKDKVIITSGEETDDYICKLAWKYWDEKHTVEDSPIVIAYCDKDIQQNCPGVLLNYKRFDEGLFLNTHEMQYKGFWKSVLMGDAADNIFGIIKLSDTILKRYGIKKAKDNACGPVAAARIICTATSEKECAERVLDAYKQSWPEDYMSRLQDMCFFLWLRREDDEMFDLKKYFNILKVVYEENECTTR